MLIQNKNILFIKRFKDTFMRPRFRKLGSNYFHVFWTMQEVLNGYLLSWTDDIKRIDPNYILRLPMIAFDSWIMNGLFYLRRLRSHITIDQSGNRMYQKKCISMATKLSKATFKNMLFTGWYKSRGTVCSADSSVVVGRSSNFFATKYT